jgi:LAGLIDADG endonuclease
MHPPFGRTLKDKEVAKFKVSSFEDIKNKIIPFFSNYTLLGTNSLSFKDFCLGAKVIEEKRHLTEEGIKELQIIKARINNKATPPWGGCNQPCAGRSPPRGGGGPPLGAPPRRGYG